MQNKVFFIVGFACQVGFDTEIVLFGGILGGGVNWEIYMFTHNLI